MEWIQAYFQILSHEQLNKGLTPVVRYEMLSNEESGKSFNIVILFRASFTACAIC